MTVINYFTWYEFSIPNFQKPRREIVIVWLLPMHLLVLGRFGVVISVILVSGILVFSAISKAEELLFVKSVECASDIQRATPVMIWANFKHVGIYLCLNSTIFEWVCLIHRIAAWWLVNGILMYFGLFVCSWRFAFYFISFFTGLAVLYDVSTQVVPPAVLPSQCLQEWQILLSNMSFQTFL